MKIENYNRQRATKVFFREDERDIWAPELLRLAKLNFPLRNLCQAMHCGMNTLTTNEDAMYVVHEGWSWYRAEVETALLELAMDQGTGIEDALERKSIKDARLKALQTIHKSMHAAPPESLAEQERIRRLSDAELNAEIQKFLNNKATASS